MKKPLYKKTLFINLKNVIWTILIGLLLAFLFYKFVNAIIEHKISLIEKNKCQTICGINEVGINRGTYIKYSYFVNGVKYYDRCASPYGADPGDHFVLNYQCNDPENNLVISNEIVFTKSELNDTISTSILTHNMTEYFSDFSFIDNNFDTVFKTQELNEKLKEKAKKNQLMVLYLKSNSLKAILK